MRTGISLPSSEAANHLPILPPQDFHKPPPILLPLLSSLPLSRKTDTMHFPFPTQWNPSPMSFMSYTNCSPPLTPPPPTPLPLVLLASILIPLILQNRKASKLVTTFAFGLIFCQNPPLPVSIESLTINNSNRINYSCFTNRNFMHPRTILPQFHQTHNLKHPNQEKGINFFRQSNLFNLQIHRYKNNIFTFTIPFSCFVEKANRRKWCAR